MPAKAIIILAAGMSRRAGAQNKLLREYKGKPLVVHCLEAAQSSSADLVIVVTGYEAHLIESVLAPFAIRAVHNPDYAQGMSSSLQAGLSALPEQIDAALICLADMPGLCATDLDRLLEAHNREEGALICVPVFAGRRGNPVLWDRYFFSQMQALKGDQGARGLILRHENYVREVEMDNNAIHFDIDR